MIIRLDELYSVSPWIRRHNINKTDTGSWVAAII